MHVKCTRYAAMNLIATAVVYNMDVVRFAEYAMERIA